MDQLLKFGIVGASGSTIDLGSLTIFVEIFGIPERMAVVMSSFLALVFVFLLNKFVTFKNRQRSYVSQLMKFSLVYGVAIMINIAISWFLIEIDVHYLLAKVIAIGTTALWNYFFSHGFIFKHKETA